MARNRDSAFKKSKTFNIINPVTNAITDGVFKCSTTSLEKYKSNLYTLLFTGVGERVMLPEFGTRLRYLLFDNITEDMKRAVQAEIIKQAGLWVPEIEILRVEVDDSLDDLENNRIVLRIDFTLKTDDKIQDFIEIEMGV